LRGALARLRVRLLGGGGASAALPRGTTIHIGGRRYGMGPHGLLAVKVR